MRGLPWLILSFLLLLSILFCINIISSGGNLGILDWDQHFAYYESARKTVVEYRQFPLWDPYHCSGIPSLGNPQSEIVSLTFLFILVFGTVIGAKISLVVHFFLGAAGFYLLSRYLKFTRWGAVFASIVFAFSGVAVSALTVGMTQFMYFFYTPYFIYFLLKALSEKKKLKNIVLSSLILSLIYYGGYQIPVLIIPIMGIFLVLKSVQDKALTPIGIGTSALLLFVFFSSPKLFLNYKLMSTFPRKIEDNSGYSFKSLLYFMVSEKQNLHLDMDIHNFSGGTDENSLYVGIIPFLFFLLGILKTKNKFIVYPAGIVILWLMLGNTIDFSLYNLLRKFPVYDSFRMAQRFKFIFLIIFSLLSAKGFEYLRARYKKYGTFFNLIPILVFVSLFIFANKNFLNYSFITDGNIPEIKSFPKTNYPINIEALRLDYKRTGEYQGIYKHGEFYKPYGTEFIAVRNNIATTNCYEQILINRFPADFGSKEYKGYAQKNSQPQAVESWSPQRMAILLSEKDVGCLTINQNYDSGWRAKTESGEAREVSSEGSLINVSTFKGDDKIILYYNPF